MEDKKEETNLNKLTNEELYIISLEKTKKNIATKKALIAQKILWERANCPFHSSAHYERDHTSVKKCKNNKREKRFLYLCLKSKKNVIKL